MPADKPRDGPQITQMNADEKEEKEGDDFPCGQETYAILGACFEVYNHKGCGFLEPVYQECMEIELGLRGIPFRPQQKLKLTYKGHVLRQSYEPDFDCYEKVIVELKAVSKLTDEHRAQLLNYLHATGCEVGLLVNFGHFPGLEYERLVNQRKRTPPPP